MFNPINTRNLNRQIRKKQLEFYLKKMPGRQKKKIIFDIQNLIYQFLFLKQLQD